MSRVRPGSPGHRALSRVARGERIWQPYGSALARMGGLAQYSASGGWSLTGAGEAALRQADRAEQAAGRARRAPE
jgi:hypothetical protein